MTNTLTISRELIEATAKEMDRLGYGHHEHHAESILHAILKADPVVERQPTCETCCDQGEVFVSKGAVEYHMLTEPDPIYEACPDCTSQPAPVSVVLPDNLESHRNTWIRAMERLVELEPESFAPDEDEKGFWRHELQAMRDMYTDLDKVKELNQ